MRKSSAISLAFIPVLVAMVFMSSATNLWAGVMYTGPGKLKEVKVASDQIYVRIEGAALNPNFCNMDWSVYPSIIVDKNRILSVLLLAKSINGDVEIGVVDNDCHEGFRRLDSVWIK